MTKIINPENARPRMHPPEEPDTCCALPEEHDACECGKELCPENDHRFEWTAPGELRSDTYCLKCIREALIEDHADPHN